MSIPVKPFDSDIILTEALVRQDAEIAALRESLAQFESTLADNEQLCAAQMNEIETLTGRAERAEAANRWIPISEGPPKEGVTVAIWARGIYPDKSHEPGAWCNSHAFYYKGKWAHEFYTPAVEVSHWMPLPEPPAHDAGKDAR